ncbi:uncharacterized protein FYW61_020167 [Anableps anableps]
MTDSQLVKELHLSISRAKQQRIVSGTMAPIGMDGVMSWVSSPEVGIISLVAFLILSITLLAICANCNRGSNAYDVNSKTNDRGANGSTNPGGEPDDIKWRPHILPENTLKRPHASTNNLTTFSAEH